ncbi:MAG: hypothetical protein U0136_13675 [Bdellovibrionota bacterium]
MVSSAPTPRSIRDVFLFWSTLAGTLLMMAAEGPIITSVIARERDAELNLAAYGVVLAIGIFCEGPILWLLSAAMALVRGPRSLRKFQNFAIGHSLLMTLILAALVAEPCFTVLTKDVLGLSEQIRAQMHLALLIYVPGPFLVGYRRLYQGLIIAAGRPRKVTQSTLLRLFVLSLAAVFGPNMLGLHGAALGSFCHMIGILFEVIATRFFVRKELRDLAKNAEKESTDPDAYTYRAMAAFYYPLALSTSVVLIGPTLESFFLARGTLPTESLALLPLVNSALNPFTWTGYAIQDTIIALYRPETERILKRFESILVMTMTALIAVFVLGPFARVWFLRVSEVPAGLVDSALMALELSLLLPAITIMKAARRGYLIRRGDTIAVLISEILELALLATGLWIGVICLHYMGLLVVSAALTVCAALNLVWLTARSRATEFATE